MAVQFLVRVRVLALATWIVLGLFICSDWRAEAAPKGIEWRSWSDDVLSEANQQGRLVLVSGASSACPWCRKMEDETFSDEGIQRLIAASFIPVRVNLRNRDEVPARFQSFVPPTIVVLNGGGSEVLAHRGYLSARELVSALNGVASDKGSAERDRAGALSIPRFRENDSIAAFNLQLLLARQGDASARQRVSQRVKAAQALANSAEIGHGSGASQRQNISGLIASAQQLVEGGSALRQPEDVRMGAKVAQTLMAEELEQRGSCGQGEASIARPAGCLSPAVAAQLMGLGASLYGLTREKRLLQGAETLQGELVREFKSGKGVVGLEERLSLVQGLLDMYSVTAERRIVEEASQVMGEARRYFTRSLDSVSLQERGAFVLVGNLLWRYTGDSALRQQVSVLAEALSLQVKKGAADPRLVEAVVYSQSEPIHVVVVGPKSDEAARKLWDEAIRLMHPYLRREWWDRAEGPLPNPDVTYPKLSRPAAFLCAHKRCSLPLFTESELREKIHEAVPLL